MKELPEHSQSSGDKDFMDYVEEAHKTRLKPRTQNNGDDAMDFVAMEDIHPSFFTSGTKDTNPKDSVGIKKAPVSTLPTAVAFEVGLAMLEGARKYGRHNYRAVGVRASVYYDAAARHLASFWEGEDIDPDSGLPHLVKAIACLAVLRDSQMVGNWVDDRPPSLPQGWLTGLNAAAAVIVEKYPEPAHTYTQLELEL